MYRWLLMPKWSVVMTMMCLNDVTSVVRAQTRHPCVEGDLVESDVEALAGSSQPAWRWMNPACVVLSSQLLQEPLWIRNCNYGRLSRFGSRIGYKWENIDKRNRVQQTQLSKWRWTWWELPPETHFLTLKIWSFMPAQLLLSALPNIDTSVSIQPFPLHPVLSHQPSFVVL